MEHIIILMREHNPVRSLKTSETDEFPCTAQMTLTLKVIGSLTVAFFFSQQFPTSQSS